ncbi:MAG TPA: TRAP transporter small permease, partial [Thalassospira sp.]|nr:TRAP transporter small permease [Thalassospira sp.]
MAVNTVANVIMRLGFSSSIFFSEELNQFLIILVT